MLRNILIACLALLLFQVAASQERSAPAGNEEYLSTLKAATRELVLDLEHLQEAIVADVTGSRERTLYRKVDNVLEHVLAFQTALKAGASRAELYRRYEEVDTALEEFLKSLKADRKSLQRAVRYVQVSEDH